MDANDILARVALPIIVAGLGVYFWMRRAAPRALKNIYLEVQQMSPASERRVEIVFPTYWGFLASISQQEHRVNLPTDLAEHMLRRLHKFNLTWGMFAAGALFIPILSWFNFRTQLKKIHVAQKGRFEVQTGKPK